MAGRNELGRRIGRVEEKLDALGQSVDTAFVEQREYTEFAFDRLATEMRASFGHVDARFNSIDGRFNSVDGRFNSVDARFDRLERKLDQFIDTQSRTNSLVERRLQGLEPPSAKQ